MTRRIAMLALGALAGLVAPASAAAAVRCVGFQAPAPLPAGCDAGYATLTPAFGAAQDGDVVRIAPGEYEPGPELDVNVTIEGAGAGTPDSFDPATHTSIGTFSGTALRLAAGGSVRSLQLVSVSGSGVAALLLGGGPDTHYSVSDVIARGGPSGSVSGIEMRSGGTATITSSTATTGSASGGAAVLTSQSGSTTVRGSRLVAPNGRGFGSTGTMRLEDSTVDAKVGMVVEGQATAMIARSRVAAVDRGVWVVAAMPGHRADAAVVDSLVRVDGGQATGAVAAAVDAGDSDGVGLDLRGSTLITRGAIGLAAVRAVSSVGAPATVELRNTVARIEGSGAVGAADLVAVGGAIGARESAFSTARAGSGGSVPAPGSAANVAGDPLFAGPDDFTLRPGSPLIDRGDPALVAVGDLDAAGQARSIDGNGDCVATPDIGAFELTGFAAPCPGPVTPPVTPPVSPAVNAAPVVSAFGVTNKAFAPLRKGARSSARRVKRGTRFRYSLSEPAAVAITIERRGPGRKVKGRCRKKTRANRNRRRCARFSRIGVLTTQARVGAQSLAFSGRLNGKPLRPGRYRARLIATDSQRAASGERRLTFRVLRAPR